MSIWAGGPVAAHSTSALVQRRLRRDRVAVAAIAILALVALVAILGAALVDLFGLPDPNTPDPHALDPLYGTATGPGADHLLGVDGGGRDVLSRLLSGTRLTLEISLAATTLSFAIGIAVGALAGYLGGWVDALLARLVDAVLAFPLLLFALGLAAACSTRDGCIGGLIRPGAGLVILVIGLSGWAYVARVVRGLVRSLAERDFVAAARGLGASTPRILVREIVPNLAGPLAVLAAFALPANMLFEAGLAFLGVGVGDRTPTWGSMVADAAATFDTAWWGMLFPVLAIAVVAIALNLLGEGIRDAIAGNGD